MNRDKEMKEEAKKYWDLKGYDLDEVITEEEMIYHLKNFAKIREEKAVESIRFKLKRIEDKYQHCSNENQLKSSLISDYILEEKEYLKQIQSLKAELKELREGIDKGKAECKRIKDLDITLSEWEIAESILKALTNKQETR